MNVDGWPMTPDDVGNSHSSLPVAASKAWKRRSLVPPVKTSPPAVASIGPQFGDIAVAVRPDALAGVDVPGLHFTDVVRARLHLHRRIRADERAAGDVSNVLAGDRAAQVRRSPARRSAACAG